MYQFDDDEIGEPLTITTSNRSSPSPPKPILEQFRERGLIKPDDRERDNVQRMLDLAVSRAMNQNQNQNRHGRTIVDRNGLLAHEHCADERDAREHRPLRVAPDEPEDEGGGIGLAGTLALLGIGWLLASFASERK